MRSARIFDVSMCAFALGGLILASAAQAQSTKLTEKSRAPYQEYKEKKNCAVGVDCAMKFDRVPLSSRLEITNVSCDIEISSTAGPPQLKFVQLIVSPAVISASSFAPIQVGSGSWAFNHPVSVFAEQKQTFQILAGLMETDDRVTKLACHISGQMVKLG